MNNKYQTIVFSKDSYNEDKDKLFEVVKDQLRILLDAGYLATVRYDEAGLGIIVIDYEHDDNLDYWGCYQPVWLSTDEVDMIECSRENNSRELVKADDLHD